MSDWIARLTECARAIENDGTPAQVGLSADECRALASLVAELDAAVLRANDLVNDTVQMGLVAQWMMSQRLSTGHGDTVENLLSELAWQVTELRERRDAAEAERDALRGVLERIELLCLDEDSTAVALLEEIFGLTTAVLKRARTLSVEPK